MVNVLNIRLSLGSHLDYLGFLCFPMLNCLPQGPLRTLLIVAFQDLDKPFDARPQASKKKSTNTIKLHLSCLFA